MFKVVIPARYASTRLPGKPLREIAGKPMVQWVYERAVASGAEEVWVATDDDRIMRTCIAIGANAVMTKAAHASGTDRIAEVARRHGWSDREIVVNVQGDEPLMPALLIRRAAELLLQSPLAGIATLATPIRSLAEFLDPNVVKVARAPDDRALYFSRAPIPWFRDGAPQGLASQSRFDGACRHLGLYAYRVNALRQLAALPPSPLEVAEKLEQLRALENGIVIAVGVTDQTPGPGVDTEQDLIEVARRIEREQAGKSA
jgi:3-deoxy-manno-octulosonate cytidylyltransferase (CMP-KDO synthetase)